MGVDPHKSSHTAGAASPTTYTPASLLPIGATLAGYRQLLRWVEAFPGRQGAIENVRGLGRHRAQGLVGWASSPTG
ncbi:MAG: hypothetical protein Kow00122_04410 [Thermoleophilia bacterium]